MRIDVLDAYRWIVMEMNSQINNRADPTKTIAMGWSAGGTFVTYLVSTMSG
jgi:acetyl esterase/lipase